MKITHLTWRPKNWVTLLWLSRLLLEIWRWKFYISFQRSLNAPFDDALATWQRPRRWLVVTRSWDAFGWSHCRQLVSPNIATMVMLWVCLASKTLLVTAFLWLQPLPLGMVVFLDLSRILRNLYFLISSHIREEWQSPERDNDERGFMEEILQIFD